MKDKNPSTPDAAEDAASQHTAAEDLPPYNAGSSGEPSSAEATTEVKLGPGDAAALADPKLIKKFIEGDDESNLDTGDDAGYKMSVTKAGQLDVHVDLGELPIKPGLESPIVEELDVDKLSSANCPPLNIVIFIVGSRGDVQPYVALALRLITTRGHRVRIATHPDFLKLVNDASVRLAGLTSAEGRPLTGNLEHFSIGGDPHELMAYMVKNPGLIPGMESLFNGDIRKKKKMVKEMLMGCYRACFSPNEQNGQPFGADAIISNPPAFAHIHVAEALGIPLLMSFTMPWTPTTAFTHPMVKAKANADTAISNWSSFILADALMWQGLGGVVNSFRYNILGLRPLAPATGPLVLERLKIPYTYAWAESLLPKPGDWKNNIDVVGFYSMPADTRKYEPDSDLLLFLKSGSAPIYIGFGSVVVADPTKLTNSIIEAVTKAGVRAVVSAGWAKIGGSIDVPNDVFIIKGDVPHDWLFADGRVQAVCHHGGAGTTCAGLSNGLPTIVVPFFGDQWFWGNAIYHAKAGPKPIPHAELTAQNLAEAIQVALSDEAKAAAKVVGQNIRAQDSTLMGVNSFHDHLPLLNMRCEIDEKRAAMWWSETYAIRLSGAVAAVLVEEKVLGWRQLVPHRSAEYEPTRHLVDPVSAMGQAILNLGGKAVMGTGQLFYAPQKGLTNLMIGLPKGSFDVISSFQEGLDNVPGLMGSEVRRRGKVDSFKSGWNEGWKGLAYGIWDGTTGLVTEPYQGAKKDGVSGLIDGSIKSLVNLLARPAGGALGLVVHPTAGAFRGARAALSSAGLMHHRSVLSHPREQQSHEAAKTLSKQERRRIVDFWETLVGPKFVDMRRKVEAERRAKAEQALLSGYDPSMPAKLVGEELLGVPGTRTAGMGMGTRSSPGGSKTKPPSSGRKSASRQSFDGMFDSLKRFRSPGHSRRSSDTVRPEGSKSGSTSADEPPKPAPKDSPVHGKGRAASPALSTSTAGATSASTGGNAVYTAEGGKPFPPVPQLSVDSVDDRSETASTADLAWAGTSERWTGRRGSAASGSSVGTGFTGSEMEGAGDGAGERMSSEQWVGQGKATRQTSGSRQTSGEL